jgi:hypothetical protein
MKWIVEIFFVVAALAVEMTVRPSRTLSIILFAIAGLAVLALALGVLWSSEHLWGVIAKKLTPFMPGDADPGSGSSVSPDRVLASAVDDLLDELNTIDGHLGAALATGLYSQGFYLPADIYHQHKGVISERDSHARSALGAVYVDADQLNNFLYRRGPGEVGRLGEPIDAEELRGKIGAARDQLIDLRPG